MIKLRFHHLMCVPRFKGEGYSKEFCDNLSKVKKAIETEAYELVNYCDDICKYCPNNIDGICKSESKVLAYDKKVELALKQGVTPLPKEICQDCSWFEICKNL